jgi:1-acyl-sn-glycerol-3-phosphate acyltransferase
VGAEKIPQSGPVVLVANHASFIDPIFLSICTKRWVQYLMYSSFYHSIAKPVFAYFCCVPVDETRFVDAIKTGSRLLERGACLGVFPEGAVSYDGKLLPAKPGALFLAQRSGAPIFPVTIVGNHGALPRGGWMPRLKKVTLIVGESMRIAPKASREDVSRTLDAVMIEFAKNLKQEWPPKEPVVFPPENPPAVRYY